MFHVYYLLKCMYKALKDFKSQCSAFNKKVLVFKQAVNMDQKLQTSQNKLIKNV